MQIDMLSWIVTKCWVLWCTQYCSLSAQTFQTARTRFWLTSGLLIPMNLMVNKRRAWTTTEQKLGRWVSENVRADRQTDCVMRSCAAVVPMILRADNSAIPTEDDNSGEGEHLNNSWGLARRLLCEREQAAYFTRLSQYCICQTSWVTTSCDTAS